MIRLFRLIWKLFILACVFGIGYIIGKEHSFEEEEEWEKEEEKLKEEQEKSKESNAQHPSTSTDTTTQVSEQISNNAQQILTSSSSTKTNECCSECQTTETKPVEFKYTNPEAKHVSIVGDFNDWNKDKNPLQLVDGIWKTTINLKPGKYEYKFVINHTDWIPDPENSEKIADKYGGFSSVKYVN